MLSHTTPSYLKHELTRTHIDKEGERETDVHTNSSLRKHE